MKIGDEEAFPIYGITIRWEEDMNSDEEPRSWDKDKSLSPGRGTNRLYNRKMFRTEKSPEELKTILQNLLVPFMEKHRDKNITNLTHEIKFIEFEVWDCEWFSHITFDVGKTDKEVLKSFQNFVDRTLDHNRYLGEFEGKSLMGAEDRYRWYANNPDGSRSDEQNIPPPCRCKFCTEQEVIRINH